MTTYDENGCEVTSIYKATERVARKVHKCCECYGTIAPGKKYLSCFGIWDAGPARYPQHLLCAEACEFIRDVFEDGHCIGFGELFEWWDESRYHLDMRRDDVREIRRMLAKINKRRRAERLDGSTQS